MKQSTMSYMETADLCRELALLLHAGVSVGDGIALLSEEDPSGAYREMLETMARRVDEGGALSAALKESGRFPVYVPGLIEVGERSGRTEEALESLGRYYETREQMSRRIRSALLYPCVLMVLMLVVIVVLLTRVLPVFNEVYASLGGHLTGVAGGLLTLGGWLDAAMPVLCVLLGLAVAFLWAFSVSGAFRDRLAALWQKRWGDRGVSRKLNDAQFAQALSMGLGSGLRLEEAMELAARLLAQVPAAVNRCEACRAQLEQGTDLAGAMRDTGVLAPSVCRLLALGVRGGRADTVMEEIARRLSRDADQAVENRVAQVEPALVLVSSILVGAILLSVMLPLMNIMTAIG
ncbi:type II secretion system F family protein [Oscillibacter sp.]|uniref:type II secretion system F family protein n=1 Tax=Oscillibacter sp. TaxID=1945593 RepID=UPI002628CC54|nr:type II secretion system F family protein [Oscillibacter sp.]MDD3347749.1 type II secretion system F family protein [Oscillibacter sp.]